MLGKRNPWRPAAVRSCRSAIILGISASLAACGGGGGSGGDSGSSGAGVNSTPTPPAAPSTTPATYTISAPARAQIGTSATMPIANGTDTMKQPAANTNFPLLQSVMKFDRNFGVGSADTATNDAGVTVRVDPATGNLFMTAQSLGIVDLKLDTQTGDDSLTWARTGVWATSASTTGISHASPFITGYETPLASIPTTGSATYNGPTQGLAYFVVDNQPRSGALTGNASFTANFGARTVQGSMTNMQMTVRDASNRDVTSAWNNVAFNANILTARNGFSGTTSVTTAPGGAGTLPSSATGTIEGRFYGPAAQEAGAVWTLHSGSTAAVGTIKGSR